MHRPFQLPLLPASPAPHPWAAKQKRDLRRQNMREHDLANPLFKSPSSSLHSAPIFFGLLSPSNSNSQTTIKERPQRHKHFLDSSAHFLDVRAFNAIDDDGQIFH